MEEIESIKKKRKSVFEQLKIQEKKLKKLEEKKQKEISQTILKSFSFLQEEEIFLKFVSEIEKENSTFLERIREYIYKEICEPIEIELKKENE
ncbi:hypothetical protein HMPREF1049_0127 [Fusobacterium necrophorum subsp. funduliforme ATCC 51357]|uniref:PF12958 family protein n=1 Tax=Fusobacterium necrophorum subsp. funduliforme TaxID=143387 RepID=A0A162IYQ4_9FUSO|nr:hypothetical protein [Fusobacterium necrophorum]EIJ72028.1 hypothetical protein HMPREF1049_0127 [Fusobacterium necrophorum subsp. funduliforme ATCC 51357]KYL04716.1 hypothetical protein A2J07_05265 [Fusobacterium necrophorum subsp. funduliforme]MCF0162266.1 hypothetical protein [Fusobacterium necrophorum]MDK4473546.1 hypothetical protein [Fusobacterium necrophorum]MDK4482133.1 hypothetical protein [Fusobacterium necrophorum]